MAWGANYAQRSLVTAGVSSQRCWLDVGVAQEEPSEAAVGWRRAERVNTGTIASLVVGIGESRLWPQRAGDEKV